LETKEIVTQLIPGFAGLAVALYVAFRVSGKDREFFTSVRNWLVISLTCVLGAFYLLLLAKMLGDYREFPAVAINFTFSVALAWLSTAVVSVTSRYRDHNSVASFRKWVRREPVNFFTGWGCIGFLLIVAAWYLESTDGLEKETLMLVVGGVYVVASVAYDVATPTLLAVRGKMPAVSATVMSGMWVMAICWTGIPTVIFFLGTSPSILDHFGESNPLMWTTVILFAIMARIALETRFTAMQVKPEPEIVKREGFRSYDIPRGIYVIEEDRPSSAFSLFSDLVTLPLTPKAEIPGKEASAIATLEFLIPHGLVVTREYPEGLREKHHLQVTPIIWLTESPGERRIAPTSLTILADTIMRFMESNPNSIVLIEGLEYLVTFNELKKVLRVFDSLNETAWITKSRLILALNPAAFDPKDLALLERDRTVLKGKAGIDELVRESIVQGAQ
jgi:hypothetical protein